MMDDDDDHLWNFSSLPPLPMDHLLPPPLPPEDEEELMHPPEPPDSSSPPHQQPFIGHLQVDSAGGGDDMDAEEVGGTVEDEADGEKKPDVVSRDSDETDLGEGDDGGEPSSKRTKYSGRDSPDAKFQEAEHSSRNSPDVELPNEDSPGAYGDVASSSQSSSFSSHAHPMTDFRNLNLLFNNNDNYDTIISEFGYSDDDHDEIVIKMEKMSEDGSSEQENNEVVGNEEDGDDDDNDDDDIYKDLPSPSSSQQEVTEDPIPPDGQDDSVPPDGEDMVIVDEVKEDTTNIHGEEDNEEDNDADGNNFDVDWEYDSDEIDAMLDEGLAEYSGAPKRRKIEDGNQESEEKGHSNRRGRRDRRGAVCGYTDKTILKGISQQRPIDFLPPGWISIVHDSGMPLYLHRPTRVVTWSRPYVLGSGSARRHKVPLSSIPCLQYKRDKEREANSQHPKDVNSEPSNNQECQPVGNGIGSSNKDKEENKENEPTANTEQVTEIVNSGQTNKIVNSEQTEIQNSGDTNGANHLQNAAEKMENADKSGTNDVPAVGGDGGTSATSLPEPIDIEKGVSKHIHICKDESVDTEEFKQYLQSIFEFEIIQVKKYRSWIDRRIGDREARKERPQIPTGPTLITCQIPVNLESGKGRKEFVINALNKSPVSILNEYAQRVLNNLPSYTYSVSNNANTPFEACVAIAGNKYGRGQAKSKRLAKVEAAQATLKLLIPDLDRLTKPSSTKGVENNLEYFDHVAIDDSRVYDLCDRAGLLTPWQLLQEYQQRNYGMTNMELTFDVQIKKHQKSEYTMKYGPHSVTGLCKNKKIGKQEGAQKMLVKLHPHLHTWGAIIKLYGTRGMSSMNMEKKELKQSVVGLQGKASHKPNERILAKLKSEMKRLYLKNSQNTTDDTTDPQQSISAS